MLLSYNVLELLAEFEIVFLKENQSMGAGYCYNSPGVRNGILVLVTSEGT